MYTYVSKRGANRLFVFAILIIFLPLVAWGMSVPNIFRSDKEITAVSLNDNFKALVSEIDSLNRRITQLQQQLTQLQTVVSAPAPAVQGSITVSTPMMTDYVNAYDSVMNGQCPPNNVMVGLYSVHDNAREDRIFKLKCSALLIQ